VFQLNTFGNAYPNTWIEKLDIDKTNRRSRRDVLSSCRDRRNAKRGTVNTWSNKRMSMYSKNGGILWKLK
jgi:hypothetical protein